MSFSNVFKLIIYVSISYKQFYSLFWKLFSLIYFFTVSVYGNSSSSSSNLSRSYFELSLELTFSYIFFIKLNYSRKKRYDFSFDSEKRIWTNWRFFYVWLLLKLVSVLEFLEFLNVTHALVFFLKAWHEHQMNDFNKSATVAQPITLKVYMCFDEEYKPRWWETEIDCCYTLFTRGRNM